MEYTERDGQLVLVEEYIQGDSLWAKIEAGILTKQDMISYTMQLCEILEKLHRMTPPVIHRDIKPSNIMITGENQVVLLDFNAAKQFARAEDSDTVLLGTQGYAAPEQYGFGSSSPQTDIYAVGITLREMLASANLKDAGLTAIAEKCTQMNPHERYDSVGSLKTVLLSLLSADAKRKKRRYLLPPGFRTGTLWKMVPASVCYLLIFWMCLTIQPADSHGVLLWLERIMLLAMLLSVILCTCNYADVQRVLPICRHPNRAVRCFGVILLDVSVTALLFMLLCIIVAVLKAL